MANFSSSPRSFGRQRGDDHDSVRFPPDSMENDEGLAKLTAELGPTAILALGTSCTSDWQGTVFQLCGR
jgi:hypothetical protein